MSIISGQDEDAKPLQVIRLGLVAGGVKKENTRGSDVFNRITLSPGIGIEVRF
jgi:hypothetical protein